MKWKFAYALLLLALGIVQAELRADGLENHEADSMVLEPWSNKSRTELDEYFGEKQAELRVAEAVRFLASDDLTGRGLGKPGLTKAAHYIANAFAATGLRTDLWDGLPYQYFPVENMTALGSTENNRLVVQVGDQPGKELKIDEDFRPMTLGGNGAFSGNLAFVGYGITASGQDWSYDEYEGIDVRDKVVIVLRKEPQQADEDSVFDGTRTSKHSLFTAKIKNAKTRGAKAMLIVNDFLSAPNPDDANGVVVDALPSFDAAGKFNERVPLPTMFITRALADQLLKIHNPNSSLIDLERSIDASLKPASLELSNLQMNGNVELVQQRLTTSNVVTVLEGKGNLADEAVVIGAHYDHVGMGEYGSLAGGIVAIHNGADDNASGTAALLELSKRFAVFADDRPENYRKIVLIAFSGEERGLLGSKYYVQHPVHDLSKTVSMINLDMIGRLGANRVIVYGIGSSPTFSETVSRLATSVGLNTDLQMPAMGPSDHQPFFEAGIPVLHFFTGIHPQYHRPSDDFEKIHTTGIVRITDMVYQVVDDLAKRSERPAYIRVPGRANIQIASLEHGSLGIRLRGDLTKPTIASLETDGPSAKAGLNVDDQVLAIGGKSVVSVPDLLKIMQDFAPKQQVEVTLLRANQEIKIPVILGHY